MKTRIALQIILVAILGLSFSPAPSSAEEAAKPKKLTAIGSDSMGSLMRAWVDAYESRSPEVNMQVVSRGSATAPAALLEGSADLGPMSRPMKNAELDQFRSRYGFEPTQIRTAVAALAVYVSPQNPIQKITFENLDGIYSSTHKRSGGREFTRWEQLGVKGPLARKTIVPIGLEPDNQSTSYFRQQVLLQGKFREDEQIMFTADNKSLFQALQAHPEGIAFGDASMNKVPARIVPVAKDGSSAALLPNEENIVSGAYPLARFLNIYVVRYPGEPLEPSQKAFLQFVLSPQGQALVKKEGLIPLLDEVLREELSKLE